MDTAKKDEEVTIATKGYPGDKKDNIETSIPSILEQLPDRTDFPDIEIKIVEKKRSEEKR